MLVFGRDVSLNVPSSWMLYAVLEGIIPKRLLSGNRTPKLIWQSQNAGWLVEWKQNADDG